MLESQIRIIVADQNAPFRENLRRLISEDPTLRVVGEAQSGGEAIKLTAQATPDTLLLGPGLPPEERQQLVERVREVSKTTKLILLVTSEDPEESLRYLRLGACGVIPHDASAEMLARCITKVHEGEFWFNRTLTAEVMREFARLRERHPAQRTSARGSNPNILSRREREIVALVSQGYRNKELAEKLLISEQTVKNHMHNIFDKLGIADRLELALYAIQNNLHEYHA